MGVIATLLPHSAQIQRLRSAIRDRHEVIECADWPGFVRVCDREPVRVAVVDFYWNQSPDFEGVRQLKQRLPRLTIVAYVTATIDRTHDLFDAGRAGVDGLVIVGRDDAPRPLLALIEGAESRSLGGLVRRSLDGIDPLVADAMLLVVTRAHERLSPQGLARLLAQPRRGVTQRLIVAAHMLEDRHRSADRVASTLDFPSGSAFRNACQRYLHATPRQIRARGGASYVVRALLRQVHSRVTSAAEPRSRSPARTPALAI